VRRLYWYSQFRLYRDITLMVVCFFVYIFSSWLTALFFVGVVLLGGLIAFILRRSEKDGL
jgi:hypothetical protein